MKKGLMFFVWSGQFHIDQRRHIAREEGVSQDPLLEPVAPRLFAVPFPVACVLSSFLFMRKQDLNKTTY